MVLISCLEIVFLGCEGEEEESRNVHKDGDKDPEDHLPTGILSLKDILPHLHHTEHSVGPADGILREIDRLVLLRDIDEVGIVLHNSIGASQESIDIRDKLLIDFTLRLSFTQ